ncbi:MAG: translation initiation factor IF-2 [Planctomycetes bacterium]|nr:translation initiation factor IF-2 [Planctomycetota bacterium]
MAKATTRVHLLAKELGVKSTAIVEKCQAEGLDIKNHMSTISAGLAATIKEWFSEGDHLTTIETSKRVDLAKVRVPKKKKKVAKKEEVVEPEAAVEEPVIEEAVEPLEESQQEIEAEKPKVKPKTKAEPKAKAEPKVKARPRVRPAPKPKPVVPAGPMLETPKPAVLSGPTVIRVEKIEPEPPRGRRPRPAGGPRDRSRFDTPISEPLMPQPESTGKGGRKTKGKKHKDGGPSDEAKQPKSTRRMRSRDMEERQARLAAARGESLRSRPSRRIETKKLASAIPIERPEKATVSEPITVKDLSAALAAKSGEIIRKLMSQGIMATANQTIANDVAELIALDLGTELTIELKETQLQLIEKEFETMERNNMERRPPIVAMLGHVDHGKTSLLDRIRQTSVADGEAGGITQHIGAYQVKWKERTVTFLDTPGHEAFTAMRARGANVTDIVVLVIAADDGVMPQTVEAIHHAKAADVEIIIALNKIDLPGVDLNRIYGQLAEHELTPSEWGGDTEIVKTSATTGQGVEDLIEHLDYIAELKEYKADMKVPASGFVVEAKMTTTQGVVATILVKEGELNKGDVILASSGYGRIKTFKNSDGKNVKKAVSSMPVEVTGLSDVPEAGEKFFKLKDINRAKVAAEENKRLSREKSLSKRSAVTLDNLFSQIEAGKLKELNLIIKADVQGSIDVLINYLTDLSTDEIKVKVLHAAVGGVTEGDVVLAEASGAIIIGFNVIADERIRELAESSGVDIRLYSIIYRITEDLKDAMIGMLEPEEQEKQLGTITVRQTFKVSGIGTIAGCYVNNGIISRNAKLRMIRGGIVVKDNCVLDSLKHFKDDVKEVKAGLECGIKVAGFDDIKVDDSFEAYEIVKIARTLL